MVTILVCGGRNYNNRQRVHEALSDAVAQMTCQGEQIRIIHGGASGADALAGEWAEMNDLEAVVFSANWRLDGRAAGPIRNTRMLRAGRPDLVVAFPGGRGTADMVSKALNAGVPVCEVVRP